MPGPAPGAEAPPHGRAGEDPWPRENEDLCWLAGHWRILQRLDGHRFSLDDLVTAEMAARVHADDVAAAAGATATARRRLLDLGCGIGTVLLFLAWRFPEAEVTGIEAQSLSASLARRSIAWNGVADRCAVLDGDLRQLRVPRRALPRVLGDTPDSPARPEGGLLPDGSRFDLVTGTPPYFARGEGTESDRAQRAPCRFEHRGGLADYCLAAATRLADRAAFVACAAALQFEEVEPAATGAGLRIERWRSIVPRAGRPPLLATFSLRRAADVGRRIEEPPLVVRDTDGQWTPAFLEVRRAMGMPPRP